MKPVYEELDYLLVPTYFPVLLLLLRAEGLLLLYEVARGIMRSTQILNAVLCALLYVDSILMQQRRSFEVYIGGIFPVALALVTNGIIMREESSPGRQDLWHVLVDTTWVFSALLAVYIAVRVRNCIKYCYASLHVGCCCGVLHIVILDGYYSTTLSTFMCRVVVFYVLGLCVYSMHTLHAQNSQIAVSAVAHKYCTLHAAVPALFIHIYVLLLYVALLLISSLWCKRADARHKSDSMPSSMPIMPIMPNTRTTNTIRSEAPVENIQNELSVSVGDDADNSLLAELKQAKMHIASAQQLGFL
mgnify:CR=1 FL=1|tara:strand:+ start:714 stop:1619 length:906 start_codon:yes stop_codon:yes gene_type:complete